MPRACIPALIRFALGFGFALTSYAQVGPFTGETDIGTPAPGPGSSQYDPAAKTLTLTAGGANIWAATDDFHFVWKKVSGDVTLAANIEFGPATAGAIAHRKAVLMLRQSLEADSAYADACIHGNGMTALQWRDAKGAASFQIQANADAPKRLRIEKRGNYLSMSIGSTDADLKPAGGACRVELQGDFYVGVGLCSHSKDRLEKATFANLAVDAPAGTSRIIINTLETFQLSSRDRKVVYVLSQPGRFEAPNWSRDDSNTLYFNNGGRLYKVKAELPSSNPTSGKQPAPEPVDLDILTRLNNDHVLSFDGKMFAVSDQSQANRQSTIWTIPVAGGTPKRITAQTPSYCHGWSPDGKTLVYAGERGGNWDIYAMAADGTGEEKRLTDTPGREDGPEYSPDGQFIYFNSDRTGRMHLWRMRPDGGGQEQLTQDDEYNDWFPHVAPNGEQMVFISFAKTVASGDHPENKDVTLRLMNLRTKAITVAGKLFGGQGTINVPSWAPNSQYFAFVSYQIIQQ